MASLLPISWMHYVNLVTIGFGIDGFARIQEAVMNQTDQTEFFIGPDDPYYLS
uniref:Uncharacterized protein n=1 Tax=Rhodnius prolixus TaxID=13249 RepID=T1I4S3_RHOPR